jgi:hypothetical protein
MKSLSLRCAVIIAVLSLLAACGGSGNGEPACTPNGNLTLHSSSSTTILLTSLTFTAVHTVPVTTVVPVFVRFVTPPVAAIDAGYPPGTTDPRTVGMNIDFVPPGTVSPIEFHLLFSSSPVPAVYRATWRFAAFDTGRNVVGCRDLPVTFTITP